MNTRSADFCADKIDLIMNFAVISNVVIKRTLLYIFLRLVQMRLLVQRYCHF